jgi:3-hydroxyacyl-[acyl-carrier-protein] dehydratase
MNPLLAARTLDIQEIQKLIPHRPPFLLIDCVEQIVHGKSAVGVKEMLKEAWYFQGHFPDHPVFPGVLMVEAMAQTAAVLVMETLQSQTPDDPLNASDIVYFMSVENAKFRKPIFPGKSLELRVSKQHHRGLIWKFKGLAFIQDSLVGEALFTAMIKNNS